MSRYPPLTIPELQAIKEANKGNPDVLRLLWEIHRLHEVLFAFGIHLRHMDPDISYLASNARAHCLALLDQEPSIRRRIALERKARRKDRGLLDHYDPRRHAPPAGLDRTAGRDGSPEIPQEDSPRS